MRFSVANEMPIAQPFKQQIGYMDHATFMEGPGNRQAGMYFAYLLR
jgi:hypothetical protein